MMGRSLQKPMEGLSAENEGIRFVLLFITARSMLKTVKLVFEGQGSIFGSVSIWFIDTDKSNTF
jgi:hypothetical protein